MPKQKIKIGLASPSLSLSKLSSFQTSQHIKSLLRFCFVLFCFLFCFACLFCLVWFVCLFVCFVCLFVCLVGFFFSSAVHVLMAAVLPFEVLGGTTCFQAYQRWNCLEGNRGGTADKRGGARMSLPERYEAILSRNGNGN